MYKKQNGNWMVGPTLGGTTGGLFNETKSNIPPCSGWKYGGAGSSWKQDDEMIIRFGKNDPCGIITISAEGKAARKQSDHLGDFQVTEMFSAGRHVFKHVSQEQYLCVTRTSPTWAVRPDLDTDQAGLESACAPTMCPAVARAGYSIRRDLSSWQYFSGEKWKDGEITVRCSRHSR